MLAHLMVIYLEIIIICICYIVYNIDIIHSGGGLMPVITFEIGKVSKEKKAQLVSEIVGKASSILSIPEQAFVTIIRENDFDNIGNGTRLLSEVHGNKPE